METIGILAGIGHLPVDVARAAKSLGYRVVVICVVATPDEELAGSADAYYEINPGKAGKIIDTLQKNGVREVTMIGKVTKEVLYRKGVVLPDLTAIKLLASLPDRKDDTIMYAIVKLIEDAGMQVMDQTKLIRPLLPPPGVLTKRQPTEAERSDMEFGFRMAKEKPLREPTPASCAAAIWARAASSSPRRPNRSRTPALICPASGRRRCSP